MVMGSKIPDHGFYPSKMPWRGYLDPYGTNMCLNLLIALIKRFNAQQKRGPRPPFFGGVLSMSNF